MSCSGPRGFAPVRDLCGPSSCDRDTWCPDKPFLVFVGRFSVDLRGMVSARGGRLLYGGGMP